MNNEIITTELEEAQALHSSIIADKAITEQALTRIALNLKTMRDKKLYRQLDCETFDAYCDKLSGIGSRQAYNLIRVLETFKLDGMERAAYLGSTKLIALTSLDSITRDELISSGEAESLSVRELKARIKELTDKCEQLELFAGTEHKDDDEISRLSRELENQKEINARHADEKAKLTERVNMLETKNKELESRPVEVAVAEPDEKMIEQIKNDTAKSYGEQIKKQQESAEKERQRIIKEYESKLAAEREEKAKLQSIAKNPPINSGDKEMFKYHLQNVLDEFNAAMALLERFDDTEEREKYRSALQKVAKAIAASLK